jgi:hypothetical protein
MDLTVAFSPSAPVALPGEGEFVSVVPGHEFRLETCSLFLGKVFGADLQGRRIQ